MIGCTASYITTVVSVYSAVIPAEAGIYPTHK